MIKATQEEILEMSLYYLEYRLGYKERDVERMDEFERYYTMRELIQSWNLMPLCKIYRIKIELEVNGYLNNDLSIN